MSQVTPEVLWAQRSSSTDPEKNFIYLTISVPDVPKSNLKLDLQPTGLTFTGHSDTLKKTYHLDLTFYAEIDPAESKVHHTARNIELKLRKKELNEEYWPRLLKDSKKVQYLKTDFDKWVDEDEQNEAPEDDFSQFGGMGGMPGMGGMGGGDFGGIDFSKLGGGDGPAGEDDEDESDDDDMPALEGEEEAKEGESKDEKDTGKAAA
ncbi:HSP20-like chaperone [Hypoxylon sp. FL0543]|nr:HSP20-like chaperone [Hypoxylon sp. FL0543]